MQTSLVKHHGVHPELCNQLIQLVLFYCMQQFDSLLEGCEM